jgi:uncharacterized protein (DUF3084 family)
MNQFEDDLKLKEQQINETIQKLKQQSEIIERTVDQLHLKERKFKMWERNLKIREDNLLRRNYTLSQKEKELNRRELTLNDTDSTLKTE